MHTNRRDFIRSLALLSLAPKLLYRGYASGAKAHGKILAELRPGVLRFLESIRYRDEGWGRWPYHAKMERPYGLQSSGHAISILAMLGALDEITEEQRAEAVTFFQGCQNAKTGWFIDPLVKPEDRVRTGGTPHSWEQIWGQWSGAASGALHNLGAKPLYAPPAAPFGDIGKMSGAEFTRSFDWRNPWAHGESWSRAIRSYIDKLPAEVRRELPESMPPKLREIFETFEEEVLDHQSGYPSKQMPEPRPGVDMAGAFKTYRAYQAAKCPWPVPQKTIDSTLALQREDGEFAYGRTLMNYDSIWVLDAFSAETGDYRREDILSAGRKLTTVLLNDYLKKDGGFALDRERCVRVHHSVYLSKDAHPIGDTMGTRMCLNTLSMIDRWQS